MACDFYNAGALLPLSDEDRDLWGVFFWKNSGER